MSERERNCFIAITSTQECMQWLSQSLKDEGEVIPADAPSIERVVQLSDAIGASTIFVQLNPLDYRQETLLIEGIIAAKPFLPVIIVADSFDQNLLLTVMRLGARDFIKIGTRVSEVSAVVKRLIPRDAALHATQADQGGKITAVISARPGSDSPMLALHLALAVQETEPTLLLDLGIPHGDAMLYLGLTASYSFIDAIRSLRRIDSTLIQNGFGKHKSGLTVLSMPEDPWTGAQFTAADVYVLLRSLRRHFSRIIVNLGGMAGSDFLLLLLGNVDQVILLVEQSVPSCRQNMHLIKHLREEKVLLNNAGVVVDHYLSKMPPDAESIAQSFGLPLLTTLSSSGMARLATMNSGESMFDLSPNDPYSLSVRKLAEKLLDAPTSHTEKKHGLLHKLISAVTHTSEMH
ncbi:Flp pilus assembly protein, ATPase CpaE [Methylophilaceae bacterium 11]|nr:Flp pilus assembly protein, ATPase CpaE [Methylophilaceae bacterium 11]